jgi:hypothetical protein
MKIMMRSIVGLILPVAMTAGCGWAQDTAQEKHVKDIRAEQPLDVIDASPLCQRTRENPSLAHHEYKVDPATWIPTLKGLMEKSDLVVLGTVPDQETVIAPSGDDAVQYFDVRVLRSWKGSLKVGETLTYALPYAVMCCCPRFVNKERDDRVWWTTISGALAESHQGAPWLYILFLRQAKGDETQLTPGLRLTGANGTQGSFFIMAKPETEEARICSAFKPGSVEKCNELLEFSQIPAQFTIFSFPLPDNRYDELLSGNSYPSTYKKYGYMPVSALLKVIQDTADSLGYPPQTDTTSELKK